MNNYDKCQKNLAGRNRMEDLFSVCGKIRLRKGEGRTLKAGGAWVYDNEIEWMSDGIIDGHLVEVLDFDDYFMGIGFINRKSKITVRMLARHTDVVDEAFIEERVRAAVEYRFDTVDTSACRLIFGEADFLPGLVIDKYSDVLVVESLALGIDRFKSLIVGKVKKILHEKGIDIRGVYERSDAKVRTLEGMERVKGFIGGEFSTTPVFQISPVGLISGVVVGVVTVFLAAQSPAKRAAKVSPISAVSGNVDNKSSVKHAIKFSLGKIDNSLGIHHAVEKKKNWFLMTASFALTIMLVFSFSVIFYLCYK